jgi:predicted NodU family carbamoyl transferase
MVTVGVYVGARESAVAVAAHGGIVSAVTHARGPAFEADDAVLACIDHGIQLSGRTCHDIDAVVMAHDVDQVSSAHALRSQCLASRSHAGVREVLRQKPWREVTCLTAQAAQFRGEAGDGVVIAVDDAERRDAQAFSKKGDELHCLRSLSGIGDMFRAAASIAAAVGVEGGDPISALDRYYGSPDPTIDAALSACLQTADGGSVRVDMNGIERLLVDAEKRCPAPLDDRDAVHVAVHRTRAALATGAVNRIADVLAEIALRLSEQAAFIGFAGSAFRSPALLARLESRIGQVRFSPVAERTAAALGASLLPHPAVSPLRDVNVGPTITDQEIKLALENCRLDYVYEPDWNKLFARTSVLLASGALVGWFHGKAEFGSSSFGARSILCDPSNQYARENVNVFLLRREAGAPLPVSISVAHTSDAPRCVSTPRFRYIAADSLPVAREKLGAAIDRSGRSLAHITDERATPELSRLLTVHHDRTGVPGLINVPLTSTAGLAGTPRAAIRESFGSAVDVLVMGRFLTSKDYWLLRSRRV